MNIVTFLVLFTIIKVLCQPRYAFVSFEPLAGGWAAHTEPWQLHVNPRQEPMCVKRLSFALTPPVLGSRKDPVLALAVVPYPPGIVVPPGAANDPCQKPGFYIWLAECNAALGDHCGGAAVPLPGGAAATAVGLAGLVSAAGGATRFIVAYVGRTEQPFADRFGQHRRDINPADTVAGAGAAEGFAKRRTWRAWFETRRSFVVGFPTPLGVSTGIEMMFLRPSNLGGGSGLRFPLNDKDSTWPKRTPPNAISNIGYLFPVQLNTIRGALDTAAGAGVCTLEQITVDANRIVASQAAAVNALVTAPGTGTAPFPIVTIPIPMGFVFACAATAGAVAAAGAGLPGAPPAFPSITPKQWHWYPPGILGTQPGSYAFDAPAGGAAPHVFSMLASQWGAKVQAAVTSLSGSHQLLGAVLP